MRAPEYRFLARDQHPLLVQGLDGPPPALDIVVGVGEIRGQPAAERAEIEIVKEFLPRQIGLAKAMGAALFAEKVTATQADQWGMIWEAVPDDAFRGHVAQRAAALAKGPTAAYARVKQALYAATDNTLEEQLAVESRLQGECGKTRDFKEGVVAFMEKRPAVYEGR